MGDDLRVQEMEDTVDALCAAFETAGIEPQVGAVHLAALNEWRVEIEMSLDESARLTAALIELSRLRSVVAGVEALPAQWECQAAAAVIEATDPDTIATNHAEGWQVMDETLRRLARRLRSVLSDTRQENAQ